MTLRLQFITYFLFQLFRWQEYTLELLNNLEIIGENIHDKNDSHVSELLLFGVSSNNDASNTCILNATMQYILATKRIHAPLTYSWVIWIIHIYQYMRKHYRVQQWVTLYLMIFGCLYLSIIIVILILV